MTLDKDFKDFDFNDFCEYITKKEQIWLGMIKDNLLNAYYIEIALEPFYIELLDELVYKFNSTGNKYLKDMIDDIKILLNKMRELTANYRKGQDVFVEILTPLFLINKFNNNVKNEDNYDLQRLQIRKEVLKGVKEHYNLEKIENLQPDYLDDDFPLNTKIK